MKIANVWVVYVLTMLCISVNAEENAQGSGPNKSNKIYTPRMQESRDAVLSELAGSGVQWFPMNDLGARADILQYVNDLHSVLSKMDEIKKLRMDDASQTTVGTTVVVPDRLDDSKINDSAAAANSVPVVVPAIRHQPVKVVEVFGDRIRLNDNRSVVTVRDGREYKGRRFVVKSGRVYASKLSENRAKSSTGELGKGWQEIDFIVNSIDPAFLAFLQGAGK